ncbi:MAG TPA: hypothetical protein VGE31_00845 [Candidatus Paceibacterota bacterium]
MKSFFIALIISGSVTSGAFAQTTVPTLTKESIAQKVNLPPSTPWDILEEAYRHTVEAESCAMLQIAHWYCTVETISTPIRDERRLNQIEFQVATGMTSAQSEAHLSQQLKINISDLRELQALQEKRAEAMRHLATSLTRFRQARDRDQQH